MHHFRHQGGVSGGNHRSQKWEANSESFHPSQCDSLDQSYRRANENGWPSEACQARAHATTRYSSLRSSSLIDDDGGGGETITGLVGNRITHPTATTRSGRVSRPPSYLKDYSP